MFILQHTEILLMSACFLENYGAVKLGGVRGHEWAEDAVRMPLFNHFFWM